MHIVNGGSCAKDGEHTEHNKQCKDCLSSSCQLLHGHPPFVF